VKVAEGFARGMHEFLSMVFDETRTARAASVLSLVTSLKDDELKMALDLCSGEQSRRERLVGAK
jgi:hypothetical protein